MTASCRPRPSLPGTIPSCGAAKRTPRTAGGSHLGKPATGAGGKDCRVSVSIRHRINSNLSRLSPSSHTWSKALRGVWQFSWDVTPWQPCSTGCDGHKHKQHWDDSALMLLEKVLSLPSYTDPASVSAPQLCAAHTSLFFPLLSKPPFALWAAKVEQSRLTPVRSAGEKWRREVVFVSLRVCLSAEKGGEREALPLTSPSAAASTCVRSGPRGLPLAGKSHQLVSGKLVAGRRETSPASQFPKGHWPFF